MKTKSRTVRSFRNGSLPILAVIAISLTWVDRCSADCIPPAAGLVSWWRSEGTTADFVGTNHGVLAGNASYTIGQVGTGLFFDGNADGVNLGSPPSLYLQNFTIETWIRRASVSAVSAQDPNDAALVAFGSGGYGLGLLNDGRLYLTRVQVSSVLVPTAITDTNWHHVAVTKSGSAVIFYVDGVAYVAPAYNPTFTFSSSLVIGASGTFTFTFWGSMDEVAIYDRALTPSEIQGIYQAGSAGKCTGPSLVIVTHPANQTVAVGGTAAFAVEVNGTPPFSFQWQHAGTNLTGATNSSVVLTNVQPSDAGNYAVVVTNLAGSVTSSNAFLTVTTVSNCTIAPSGLVSWWRAEGNALDTVDGNSGAFVGNTAFGPGRVGAGFLLDGNQDGVTLGNPANLQLQNFTVEAWIRRASSSLVSLDTGGNAAGTFLAYGTGGYGFQIVSDGRLALGKLGVSAAIATGTGFTDLNWHHVAVTKSGTNVVFYRDGAVNSAATYDPGFTFNTTVTIGAWGSGLANSFLGAVDELAVYNRALTSNEIATLFASGDGKCLTLPPSAAIQPINQSVGQGATATFTALTGGTPPFSFQWQHAGTNLPGATSASLVLSNVQPTEAGNYSVRVTNLFGSMTSSNAVLTVLPVFLRWSTNLGATLFAVDDQTNAYANVDGTVIKVSGDGVPLQTNNLCPRGRLARRDAAGNYFFTGNLPSRTPGGVFLVFDPLDFGGGIILSNSPVFVAKYSSAGSLLWATNFGPTSGLGLRGIGPTDFILDDSGNALVAYWYHSSTIDHDVAITTCSSAGAILWTGGLPKPTIGNNASGYGRLGAISPTNGFGVHFTTVGGSHSIALSTFSTSGNTTVANWIQNLSSAPTGTRPIRNSFGEVYNVERGNVLTKRTASGALIWTNNTTSSIKWTVGQDQWDGVHVADASGPLLRYDFDGNLVWTIPISSPVVCMEVDAHGNRFISTANGIVARLTDELLAAPSITTNPAATTVFAGTNVTLMVGASGTTPLHYSWFNGVNPVAGGTNATLSLVNPNSGQSGSYSVIVSNFLGSVTSTPVQVRIKQVQFYIGSQMLTNGTYVFATPQTLSVRSAFASGSSFYTLDGSPPSFASTPYTGPFMVSSSATLRALGYSADFLQSEEADPVNLVLPATYTLTAGTLGPGSVDLNPPGGVYLDGTEVTLTATPGAGWMFHHWAGDAFGTSPSINVAMTQDRNIQAVFATTLSTTVAGNGQVQPAGGVYPYGSVVRLSAVPQPGNYFGIWGNAASGNANPLYFPITNANPTVSSLFASLPSAQAALTVLINGPGSVNVNPPGNLFATNQSVTLTAIPHNGQGFIDWTGDASGTQNPLTVAMTQSRIITANFTNWPVLVADQQSVTPQGFRLSLLSGPGLTYQVQGSTNLWLWADLGVVTNATGETQFTDPAGTNLPLRFYRATAWP